MQVDLSLQDEKSIECMIITIYINDGHYYIFNFGGLDSKQRNRKPKPDDLCPSFSTYDQRFLKAYREKELP